MPHETSANLTRYAWLSIAAAFATMGIKTCGYLFTHSVSLLSDALESIVNAVSAFVALLALRVAARPADEDHPHGHEKVEYFASGLEGALVCAAAVLIWISAASRLWDPKPLEQVGLGLAATFVASSINLAVSLILHRAAKQHQSIVLEADASHLMSDVWTSVGIFGGLTLVHATGKVILDPIFAIVVGGYIARTGVQILWKSAAGLLDSSLPEPERRALAASLEPFVQEGIEFHALRTRYAGAKRFVSVHVLVPGDWTVQRGHDLVERVEAALRGTAPRTVVFTHMEPREDARSFESDEY